MADTESGSECEGPHTSIQVPGVETERISRAAKAGRIYVIVGCWELHDDGTFVVVWQSPDTNGTGVFGQRFDADGLPIGAEFQVSTGGGRI